MLDGDLLSRTERRESVGYSKNPENSLSWIDRPGRDKLRDSRPSLEYGKLSVSAALFAHKPISHNLSKQKEEESSVDELVWLA